MLGCPRYAPPAFCCAVIAARRVDRELLDDLPADDPRAVHARRDLKLCNALMLQPAIMVRLLKRFCAEPPVSMVDIGSGDGTFALTIARRLARHWPGVSVTLVDRQAIVGEATVEAFGRLGWRAERVSAEVFEFFARSRQYNLVIANLFLHHFASPRLSELLAAIARSTAVFIAAEPRRGPAAAIGSRFLPIFGCNEITQHDAAASVRAGFRGNELSDMWPQGWSISEHEALPFSHCFAATRAGWGAMS
jgi:2-polyprenyl-3-methyl-5-hydroxy-6-metoxy-1,4-benzoquinol methylase